jgi:hypothetical protein
MHSPDFASISSVHNIPNQIELFVQKIESSGTGTKPMPTGSHDVFGNSNDQQSSANEISPLCTGRWPRFNIKRVPPSTVATRQPRFETQPEQKPAQVTAPADQTSSTVQLGLAAKTASNKDLR